jgi:hypothetical protein
MSRVESPTSTGMVRAVWGSHSSPPVSGFEHKSPDPLGRGVLDTARMAVRQVVGSNGFIDITGPEANNFKVYLRHTPVDLNMEDLKPGLLKDLASWVASELGGDPSRALDAQANVQPEAAVKLLT